MEVTMISRGVVISIAGGVEETKDAHIWVTHTPLIYTENDIQLDGRQQHIRYYSSCSHDLFVLANKQLQSRLPMCNGAPYREVNSKVATAPKLKVEDKDRVNNS